MTGQESKGWNQMNGTASTAPVRPSGRITTIASSRLRRMAILAGTLTLAVTAALGPTSQAVIADGNNSAEFMWTDGLGASAGATVGCDRATRRVTVTSVYASTMTVYGPYGPVASQPYNGGQYLRYRVQVRRDLAGGWVTAYDWSTWTLVKSVVYAGSATITGTAVLSGASMSMQGSSGHAYEVRIQVGWWVGAERTANVTPTYSVANQTAAYNAYATQPPYCLF